MDVVVRCNEAAKSDGEKGGLVGCLRLADHMNVCICNGVNLSLLASSFKFRKKKIGQ